MTERPDRISPDRALRIIAIVEGWPDRKISWNRLVDASRNAVGRRFSRQALSANPEIYQAYVNKKRLLRPGRPPPARPTMDARLAAALREREKLARRVAKLEERFIRWVENAQRFGVNQVLLETPLEAAPRESSDARERVLDRRANQIKKQAQSQIRLRKNKRPENMGRP